MNNNFKFKAIAFDMDGVLIDSKKIIENNWSQAAKNYGLKLTSDDIQNSIHGRSGEETLDLIFHKFSPQEKRQIKQLVDNLEETSSCQLLTGVLAFIKEISLLKIPIVLVTSSWKERILFILKEHKLENIFLHIINRYDVKKSKPSPDCYLLAAKKLGIAPKHLLVFEDSISGIQAAVESGALCIGVNNDLMENYGCKVTIKDFTDLDVIYKRPHIIIKFYENEFIFDSSVYSSFQVDLPCNMK